MEGLFFGFLVFAFYSLLLYIVPNREYNSIYEFIDWNFLALLIFAFVGFMIFMIWNL